MKFTILEFYLAKILKRMRLRAVKNSEMSPSASIGPGTEFINSKMGKHSYCGYNCMVIDTSIGAFCSIASNCNIGADGHSVSWVSTSPVFNKNRSQIKNFKFSEHDYQTRSHVEIGNDVWIGEKVIIKSGVAIGHGAIVGAGSVVTKNIPPYEIWGGVPAKLIKPRFSDASISARLLNSKWWALDEEKLRKAAVHIKDPTAFLDYLENNRA